MITAMLAFVLMVQAPQVTLAHIDDWFEAGQYQRLVDAAPQLRQPQAQYLVALSYQRLDQPAAARQVLSDIANRGDADPWSWIARSTKAIVTADGIVPDATSLDAAESDITQALVLLTPQRTGPAVALANYQHGQILTYRRDYAQAAEAFERTIAAMPSFAYAHYYAGMSYRETMRIDQMANRFDEFLEQAPAAPERARVRTMMRTIRGR